MDISEFESARRGRRADSIKYLQRLTPHQRWEISAELTRQARAKFDADARARYPGITNAGIRALILKQNEEKTREELAIHERLSRNHSNETRENE